MKQYIGVQLNYHNGITEQIRDRLCDHYTSSNSSRFFRVENIMNMMLRVKEWMQCD